ncbi:MAG: glycosyltransferase family 4 protein [Candidatus Hydrothermae bacterium]|nr:glycosyltransferase family 4 protein [Candidatus Hydrothermae bacterium]
MDRKMFINVRVLRGTYTGVQRYVEHIMHGLDDLLVPVRPTWSSPYTDHLWEQMVLPLHLRGRWLFSPSTTGPIAYARQVVTVHDVYPLEPEARGQAFRRRWFRWVLPRLLPRVQHMIVVSRFARDRLLDRVPGVAPERISMVYHGVDLERFSPGGTQVAARKAGVVLSVVSTLSPHKGVDRLKRFAARLNTLSRGRLRLRVVGGLPGEHLTSGEGLEWVGYVPPDRLPALYREAFAFVYLSRYDSFGFPVLEALASGLPVVTSGVGGIPEIQGEVGYTLQTPQDPDRAVRWVLRLWENPDAWRRERKRSRRRAERFSWDRTLQKTRAVLERVMHP